MLPQLRHIRRDVPLCRNVLAHGLGVEGIDHELGVDHLSIGETCHECLVEFFELIIACEEYGELNDRAFVLVVDRFDRGGRAKRWFEDGSGACVRRRHLLRRGAAPSRGGFTQTKVFLPWGTFILVVLLLCHHFHCFQIVHNIMHLRCKVQNVFIPLSFLGRHSHVRRRDCVILKGLGGLFILLPLLLLFLPLLFLLVVLLVE